jgi:DUF971 family protein
MSTRWPTELRLAKERNRLNVTFEDGSKFSLPAEYLRVESPSAEVQGHGGQQKVIVLGKANVLVTAIELVGNYAVRIIFDDGHDSGLFSWDYLYELGRNQAAKWAAYLAAGSK